MLLKQSQWSVEHNVTSENRNKNNNRVALSRNRTFATTAKRDRALGSYREVN